ncbi:VanW family protein [Deinococcus aerophilus]|uniref:VanW family protein n=1 Tax=Deinococcus aerophilus TaxID=522488 RepID=UPI001663319C|nr:VanW family protein [Deinococcus aerophilus]
MKFWVGGISALALLGGALAVGAVAGSDDQLAPGFRVGGVDVGGLTRAQALAAVSGQTLRAPQVTVVAGHHRWTVEAGALGWHADAEASVAAAERATAERTALQRLRGLVGQEQPQNFPLVAAVDAAAAGRALATLTAGLVTPPTDARVYFDKVALRYAVRADAPGQEFEVEAAARAYAAAPATTLLRVTVQDRMAQVRAQDLQGHVAQGNALMRPFGATLAGTKRKGVLTALQVANLYWVRPEGVVPDPAALKRAFGLLTETVDQPARNARFAARGDKLVGMPEQAGRVTDRAAAYAAFKTAVFDASKTSVILASRVTTPTLTLKQLPDAGKLQLIHTGRSTYDHSSPERRTNVANAAARIDGTVVPVGGTFSFLENLGSITPENGFVGGLIISGGRTVDGLGGGVCQVSTTTFRALYGAGLPVVERNQHSYRVGYYEPQVGFEAAVYDPGLDLKMKNDTGGPLLIRTVNDDAHSTLEVQLWGLKPQRTVKVSPAVILSRTAHPPAKYVVNEKMRPGTSRQVDWAQDGYKLYITRTIKDSSGVRTDTVGTEYQPWQAVYEVGPSN